MEASGLVRRSPDFAYSKTRSPLSTFLNSHVRIFKGGGDYSSFSPQSYRGSIPLVLASRNSLIYHPFKEKEPRLLGSFHFQISFSGAQTELAP
jgi:hypothetical protein